MKSENPKFNPSDSEYKKVSDLPGDERPVFKDVKGGFVKKTAQEIDEIKGSTEQIQRRETQIKFIDELNNLLAKFDDKTKAAENTFGSIDVLKNGEISGNIFDLRVSKENSGKQDQGGGQTKFDKETVLKSIALLLQKHGVKVYSDYGNLIVVQKHEGDQAGDSKSPKIHCLDRSDRIYDTRLEKKRDSIFAEGAADKYRLNEGKLIAVPGRLFGDIDRPEPYEVPEFSETEEDVIRQGRERKLILEQS